MADADLPERLTPEQAEKLFGVKPPSAPAEHYGTTLSPREEKSYQRWKKTLPDRLQNEGDYDLRGFYRKNPNFSVNTPGQHMTDKFKLPNHETFSNESQYYNDKTAIRGGKWSEGPNGSSIWTPNDPKRARIVEDAQGNRVNEKPSPRDLPDRLTPEQAQKL
ncbi:MAG TPA: hypothetical protein VE964_17040, partial [Myxococcales bacterium]|nr:hypothetical protein [Myxococcales bacterium]